MRCMGMGRCAPATRLGRPLDGVIDASSAPPSSSCATRAEPVSLRNASRQNELSWQGSAGLLTTGRMAQSEREFKLHDLTQSGPIEKQLQ